MNSQIRRANIGDANAIAALLDQLGYPDNGGLLAKIEKVIAIQTEHILVYEESSAILAVIALHIVPELALAGDTATIKYFVVAEHMRGNGIGQQLEEACCAIAKAKSCARIQLHCGEQRERTHQFYYNLGYEESPKFFTKAFI